MSLVIFIILFLIIGFIVYYKLKNRDVYPWDVLFKIPGPKGYPIIGNLLEVLMSTREMTFQRDRTNAKKFYPLFKQYSFNLRAVAVMNPEDIQICVISLIFILFLKIKHEDYPWDIFFRIPGPKGLPILGNLLQFCTKTREENFNRDRMNALKFFPIYKEYTFNIKSVSLLKPEDIESVLNNMKHISKNDVYHFLHRWLGTGLLTSTGAKWQSRRKLLTPAFHFNILQDFLNIFNNETQTLVKNLEKQCDQPFIDVKVPITEFTLYSIAETAMGIKLDNSNEEQTQYKKSICDMGEITIYRLLKPWLFNPFIYSLSQTNQREKRTVKILHNFTNSVIKNRKQNFDVNSKQINGSYSVRKKLAMLDLLLTYQKEGADISDEGIREEVDTFMFEGHDTTSVALGFILMTLANETKHQEEVYKELMDIVGDKTPDYYDLQELKYMELCIKEVLRLYPSVPTIGRISGEDIKTHSGYIIPKETDVIIQIFDMHHNPHVFENPEKFDPNRFLPENIKTRHPFAYLPFSAGPRNCIGQKFAMLELKAALCGILRAFKLEAVDTPKDMVFFQDIVLRTTNPIRVKFVKR